METFSPASQNRVEYIQSWDDDKGTSILAALSENYSSISCLLLQKTGYVMRSKAVGVPILIYGSWALECRNGGFSRLCPLHTGRNLHIHHVEQWTANLGWRGSPPPLNLDINFGNNKGRRRPGKKGVSVPHAFAALLSQQKHVCVLGRGEILRLLRKGFINCPEKSAVRKIRQDARRRRGKGLHCPP